MAQKDKRLHGLRRAIQRRRLLFERGGPVKHESHGCGIGCLGKRVDEKTGAVGHNRVWHTQRPFDIYLEKRLCNNALKSRVGLHLRRHYFPINSNVKEFLAIVSP